MIINNIYAGIVTYNPDIELLKKNINAIYKQVPIIVIVDNGSTNIKVIKQYVEELNNVKLLCLKSNMGIAIALNLLMKYGDENQFDWMLSLDQDSVCSYNYCLSALDLLDFPNVGIVGPVIKDRKVGIVGHNPKGEYGIVNTCITSGAFVRVDVWKKVGGYDEKMFIDSVDFEFCYRVRKKGYKIIQSNKIVLEHSIGKGRTIFIGPFQKRISEHSAFRSYYIAQNNIYYPKKHRLILYFIRGNCRNINYLINVFLFESNKLQKIKSIFQGWKNGYKL